MDITEITDDMIGKKITCYIDNTFIDDGEITKEDDYFYILQNKKDGVEIKNKKGYEYSWNLQHFNNPSFNGVKEIKFKETSIELWI